MKAANDFFFMQKRKKEISKLESPNHRKIKWSTQWQNTSRWWELHSGGYFNIYHRDRFCNWEPILALIRSDLVVMINGTGIF